MHNINFKTVNRVYFFFFWKQLTRTCDYTDPLKIITRQKINSKWRPSLLNKLLKYQVEKVVAGTRGNISQPQIIKNLTIKFDFGTTKPLNKSLPTPFFAGSRSLNQLWACTVTAGWWQHESWQHKLKQIDRVENVKSL